jgi:hypothetical protein
LTIQVVNHVQAGEGVWKVSRVYAVLIGLETVLLSFECLMGIFWVVCSGPLRRTAVLWSVVPLASGFAFEDRDEALGREWEGTVNADGSAGSSELEEKYALPKR